MNDDRASFGFSCWSDPASVMTAAHQHNDIEFNFAEVDLAYAIGGERVVVGAGRVTAFWAATPHQLVESAGDAVVTWLTVPLEQFLRWRVPAAASRRLLAGRPLVAPEEWSREEAPRRLAQWRRDLSPDPPGPAPDLAELEVEAFVRRFALVAEGANVRDVDPADSASQRAATMASFIASNFASPLRVADIAGSVHLHPNYATAIFTRVFGLPPGAYLLKFRIGEAQRMLLRSRLPVGEVGLACGFTSASAFYEAFTTACGMPPGQWRRAHSAATE